ncbi:sensor histidine kinase, partial [Myxococcota bacterium]
REPRKAMTGILDVIDTSLRVVENVLRLHKIRVERDLPANLPDVHIDANQMKQVFVNLLLNAAEAIDNDGIIGVHGRVEPVKKQLIVEISDTGCGIAPEVMASIFEPFFTTKSQGTGLGLSVSYGIVQSHNGSFTVSSQLGRGSRFTISLPIHQESESTTLLLPDREDSARKSEGA